MSRIITLVVAVVAAALVAVPLAAGQSPDVLERAVQAKKLSNRTSSVVTSDAFERAVLAGERSNQSSSIVASDAFQRAAASVGSRPDFWNYDPRSGQRIANASPGVLAQDVGGLYSTTGLGAPSDRSIGLNRQYGLGEFAAVPRDAFERAAEAGRSVSGTGDRSIGLNRTYGLGDYAPVTMIDTHDRIAPVSEPVSIPTVDSGRDLDWPQLGIGFGIGLLLAAGLLMALRMTRIRPLAH